MGVDDRNGAHPLSGIDRVRCLNCAAGYVKPAGGGTVSENPGCPECGYVGWVLERAPITADTVPTRSFVGRPRRRTG